MALLNYILVFEVCPCEAKPWQSHHYCTLCHSERSEESQTFMEKRSLRHASFRMTKGDCFVVALLAMTRLGEAFYITRSVALVV